VKGRREIKKQNVSKSPVQSVRDIPSAPTSQPSPKAPATVMPHPPVQSTDITAPPPIWAQKASYQPCGRQSHQDSAPGSAMACRLGRSYKSLAPLSMSSLNAARESHSDRPNHKQVCRRRNKPINQEITTSPLRQRANAPKSLDQSCPALPSKLATHPPDEGARSQTPNIPNSESGHHPPHARPTAELGAAARSGSRLAWLCEPRATKKR
jgi:hypothetical protein